MPRRAPTTHKTTVRRNHRPGVLWAFAAALVGLPAAVAAAQFVVDFDFVEYTIAVNELERLERPKEKPKR